MSRARRLALIAAAVVLFLAVSAALARVLGAGNAERDATVELVRAEARGDTGAIVARLDACGRRPACRADAARSARRLRRPGDVRILRYDGPGKLALSSRTGTARVAWRAGDALPVVQCVRLRRHGDIVHGFDVRVLAISRPRPREADC